MWALKSLRKKVYISLAILFINYSRVALYLSISTGLVCMPLCQFIRYDLTGYASLAIKLCVLNHMQSWLPLINPSIPNYFWGDGEECGHLNH